MNRSFASSPVGECANHEGKSALEKWTSNADKMLDELLRYFRERVFEQQQG